MANSNTTGAWLDPPQLIGSPNSDGTISLTPLELKRLNDYNYDVAKMVQGGLNLANLNKDTNGVFTGLAVDVSNLDGDLTSLSVTVDGMRIADETGSYTIIDGDKFVSKDHDTGGIVEIKDGSIFIKNGSTTLGQILPSPTLGIFIEASTGKYVYLSGKVQVGMYDEVSINGSLIKLASGGNMSIDSSGTIYIGSSAGYTGNVSIGQAGGRIDLNCDVYYKGVLLQ